MINNYCLYIYLTVMLDDPVPLLSLGFFRFQQKAFSDDILFAPARLRHTTLSLSTPAQLITQSHQTKTCAF